MKLVGGSCRQPSGIPFLSSSASKPGLGTKLGKGGEAASTQIESRTAVPKRTKQRTERKRRAEISRNGLKMKEKQFRTGRENCNNLTGRKNFAESSHWKISVGIFLQEGDILSKDDIRLKRILALRWWIYEFDNVNSLREYQINPVYAMPQVICGVFADRNSL